MEFTGKNAVVTGGAGTIGKAITQSLLSAGCNVYITGRNQARLNAVISDLKIDESTGQVYTLVADCTNEESVINGIFAKVEGVDLLINNAGTLVPGETENISADDFNKVMQVNVTGPFICAREAMKKMKERGQGGRIINIGSVSAISPRPHSAPYTTSKFALLGLTQSLALDCRDYNIAVGIIHPGSVVSNLLSKEEIEKREKAEGFMQPEDVASCVMAMAGLPISANILEMTVIPTRQPLVGRG
mmetsp:Transcript_17387/g.21255  ORF Transcript_17387/g.21255 Transcript_17387/m.21255 type:complete len:245 (-) Transcript_17387:233-967(-)